MQNRLIRATSVIVVFLIAFCMLMGSAAWADDSLRIERPKKTETAPSPAANASTKAAKEAATSVSTAASTSTLTPAGSSPDACCGTAACGSPVCADKDLQMYIPLSSALPAEGLYTRWRNEFVNPTMCPIRLCHGTCAKTQMGCKNIKTMIDSLLDAYIPEEQPIQAVLNFRCCAGFTDE